MAINDPQTPVGKLFEEFPPVTKAQWEEVIHEDLKGGDYEKKLVWSTAEGFKVRPYYRLEDIENISFTQSFPGEFPFVRGGRKEGNAWFIRQDICVQNDGIVAANKKAVEILHKGADSIGFIVNTLQEFSYTDFCSLLKGILIKDTEINFAGGPHALNVVSYWKKFLQEQKTDAVNLHGSIDFDPLGYLTKTGGFSIACNNLEGAMGFAHQMVSNSQDLTGLKVIVVSGHNFGNAGGSAVQELAFSLSAGVEYLNQLTEKGLSVDQIAPHMKFVFSAGSNYFMEIAKLRAARMLWANIVKAYGPANEAVCKMTIHSVTVDWNKSLYDPYVNMLRTTTEAMSAAIGGSDSLTVKPFNSIYEDTTEFSERIARNQQLILKEESKLDKVVDPSAGSYYIETLTASIADETWKLFLKTEEKGGYYAAFVAGFIQEQLADSAKKRDLAYATRREIILGTNQYPNFNEKITKEIPAEVIHPEVMNTGPAIAEPIKIYRGANAFVELRLRTDMFSLKNKRPAAFMLTYGGLSMRRARSQFSSNFFACAGFEVIDNNGFATVDEGVAEALASKAEIVVVCAADEDYALIGAEIAQKLNGKALMVIAGNPPCAEELKAAGISHFIHVRTNVLEALLQYQKELSIL